MNFQPINLLAKNKEKHFKLSLNEQIRARSVVWRVLQWNAGSSVARSRVMYRGDVSHFIERSFCKWRMWTVSHCLLFSTHWCEQFTITVYMLIRPPDVDMSECLKGSSMNYLYNAKMTFYHSPHLIIFITLYNTRRDHHYWTALPDSVRTSNVMF